MHTPSRICTKQPKTCHFRVAHSGWDGWIKLVPPWLWTCIFCMWSYVTVQGTQTRKWGFSAVWLALGTWALQFRCGPRSRPWLSTRSCECSTRAPCKTPFPPVCLGSPRQLLKWQWEPWSSLLWLLLLCSVALMASRSPGLGSWQVCSELSPVSLACLCHLVVQVAYLACDALWLEEWKCGLCVCGAGGGAGPTGGGLLSQEMLNGCRGFAHFSPTPWARLSRWLSSHEFQAPVLKTTSWLPPIQRVWSSRQTFFSHFEPVPCSCSVTSVTALPHGCQNRGVRWQFLHVSQSQGWICSMFFLLSLNFAPLFSARWHCHQSLDACGWGRGSVLSTKEVHLPLCLCSVRSDDRIWSKHKPTNPQADGKVIVLAYGLLQRTVTT